MKNRILSMLPVEVLEKRIIERLERVKNNFHAPLKIILQSGAEVDFADNPSVIFKIHDNRILLNLSVTGLASGYVEGLCDIVKGDLKEIIEIGYTLSDAVGDPDPSKVVYYEHSAAKDKDAISYHYDVSNDFYRLFLDSQMLYSCAYFANGDEDLETAQKQKIDHILAKLRIQPGQRLLDIGCGWGSLVLRAAQQYGARCVGVTLSEEQCELATERVKQAGLADRIDIRLQDYRNINDGPFDRITSVGMFEHVGTQNLESYARAIHHLLADDGVFLNHGITATNTNAEAVSGGDFMTDYVFPRGELSHMSWVCQTMQQGGLELVDVENLRRHYAQTCAIWAQNFEHNSAQIKQIVSDKQYRIWRIYLAGCAYAFKVDNMTIYQFLAVKERQKADNIPWSRQYMYADKKSSA